VADEFRKQMTSDIENLRGTLAKCRDMIEREKKKRADFNSRVDSIEREIYDRAEKLKKLIDEEKADLVKELRSFKEERAKQINHVVSEIKERLSFVESQIEYTEQLRDKGTASDVAQQTNTLHDRVSELVTLDVLRVAVQELGFISVSFTATPWPGGCVIGQIGN